LAAQLFNVVTFGQLPEPARVRRLDVGCFEEVDGLDKSLAMMVQNGNAEMAAEQFKVMAAEAQRNGVSLSELKTVFPGYQDALKGIDNDQKVAAESSQLQSERPAFSLRI
jgi:hypothetical protein